MLLDLSGKKILVTGIANNRSIAWGIAQQLKAAGAELGITYLPDEKGRFEAKVKELTSPLNPSLFLPLNVQNSSQIEEVFEAIKNQWGQLDGLVHCLAFAGKEELVGNYSATSSEGFSRALEISAYSLAPLCKYAKPLFSKGAGVVTLTYLGAERAIPNYNVMGVAKAALSHLTKELAIRFASKGIQVNCVAYGGVEGRVDAEFKDRYSKMVPMGRMLLEDEITWPLDALLSEKSRPMTGQTLNFDGGWTIW